jgi:hypothetical protein
MPRLHCEISADLNRVIKRAKIRGLRTKGRVLKRFIRMAVEDRGEYAGGLPYGDDRETTATISNFSDAEYDKTVDYREKWMLGTQKEFFKFSLQHGASLWERENGSVKEQ